MPNTKEQYDALDRVIEEHIQEPGALMPVLQGAQEIFGCVPIDVQKYIAQALHTTLSDVYGVATFYSQFSLQPKGEYLVSVCLGTACYVKGSEKVLSEIERVLGVKADTVPTEDGLFSVNALRCVGACGLAPVMVVNGKVYGKMTPAKAVEVIKQYKEQG